MQFPNGVHLIFKLPFPNGSYRNGVCRALWAWFFDHRALNRLKRAENLDRYRYRAATLHFYGR